MLLNNILLIKSNCVSHILRRNCLLHVVIEGQITEVKVRKKRDVVTDDFEIQKKILGAKGGSWRFKTVKTTVYQSNIRKKFKFSSTSPWPC